MKSTGNKAWQDLDNKNMDLTELGCEACTTRRKCFDCEEAEKYTKKNMQVIERSQAELKPQKRIVRHCQRCNCVIDEKKSYFFCDRHAPENDNVNMIFRQLDLKHEDAA